MIQIIPITIGVVVLIFKLMKLQKLNVNKFNDIIKNVILVC